MKFEIKHRFNGSVLFSLETTSLKSCVEAAVKSGADLCGADLCGASLRDADLRGADLRGADLCGAEDVISAGQPNGWFCHGWHKDGVIMIRAGCRNFTLAEGREYWQDKPDRREILAALDYIERVAALREWPIAAKAEAA